MLRPRNTRKWVHKSGVKRLTMHSVLFSLWSRGAVPRRWDSRMLFGAVSGAWQRARLAIRSDLADKTFVSGNGRQGIAVLLAVLLASLAGCASMSRGGADLALEAKQALVTERINARWEALIKGDLDTAYTYMSAASKETIPLTAYKAKIKPGMWRSVKINAIVCEAEICTASMTLTYDHRLMKGVQTPFQESWIIEKGTAWFVARDNG